MIIVYFTQQLGNQMFQYALGRYLETLGKDVKFWTGYYDKFPNHDFALPRLFNLSIPEAREEDVQRVLMARRRITYRVMKRLFKWDRLLIHEMKNGPEAFNSQVFKLNHGILNGYWQSEKYFAPIANIIRKEFTFFEPSSQNKELADKMSSQTSVSIHVRRGDYAGLYPLLGEEYYTEAMSYFIEKFKDVFFYVFSNDIPWCREHLKSDMISFVDWNKGLDSPYDMWLMTQCKHNIIANSTFSWWGAWLNNNKGKQVIAPKIWDFHNNINPDIYCQGWIVI